MTGFVKLDTGMLNSSIWIARDLRSVFVTALLMAEPYHLKQAAPQIEVRSLELTGWSVPVGWYGKVEAAGVGILLRDGIKNRDRGLALLEELCAPDPESRSEAFEGRRMARINGGYIVLNYYEYRERDYRRSDPRGQAESYVYYARDEDVIKIGLSKNPWARMNDLRVSRPHISILATEKGGSDLETLRHTQFKADCVGGEWFRVTDGLLTHIAAISDTATVVDVETPVVATVATVDTTKRQRQRTDVPPPPPPADDESQSPTGSSAMALVSVVPAEFRPDMRSLMLLVPNVTAWTAEMRAAIEGMHGKPITAVQLGQAVRDYLASGKAKSNPSLRSFRRYMQGVLEVNAPVVRATNGTNGKRSGPKEYDYSKTTDNPKDIKWQT